MEGTGCDDDEGKMSEAGHLGAGMPRTAALALAALARGGEFKFAGPQPRPISEVPLLRLLLAPTLLAG